MRRLGPLPALVLLALVASLLAPVLSGRATFFYRDIQWVWYPWFQSMAQALAQGAWPLWDPHSGFGQPALANPAYQVAYPLAWTGWLLPSHPAYAVYVFLHLCLAGLGTALLARAWDASRVAATLAAALWVCSGPLLSFTSLHHHFAGLCWMPWGLLTVERILRTPTARAARWFGAVVALQLLAGSADMVVMTALLALLRLALAASPQVTASRLGSAALWRLALGLGLAVALSAVQWFPTFALVRGTARERLGSAANLYWSLHPLAALDLLAAGAVSGPDLPEGLRQSIFEGREPFLTRLYLGAASLPLVLLGCRRGPGPGRVLVTAALALLLVLALGRHTVVYPALAHLPPFSMLRYPVKFVGALSLVWALAAGLGLDAARRGASGTHERWVAGVTGVSVLMATGLALLPSWGIDAAFAAQVTGALWRSAAWILATGLLGWAALRTSRLAFALLALAPLADVGSTASVALSLAPRALASYEPDWVAREPPGTRLAVRQPPSSRARELLKATPPGWSDDWWWSLGMLDLAAPPIGARWSLDGGYDGDPVGLARPPMHWLSRAVHEGWGRPTALRLLQMGAVGRVASYQREAWLGPAQDEFQSVFAQPLRLYSVPDALPRALLVEGARIASDAEAFRILTTGSLDPRQWVLLADGQPRSPGPGSPGEARVVERRADRLVVAVECRRPAHLVVQEAWDAGWLTWVDGRPVPLRRANLVFRAVDLQAGQHRVEMRYRPRAALLGGIVTVAALAGLAALLPLRRRS